jgi:hypothetical protein
VLSPSQYPLSSDGVRRIGPRIFPQRHAQGMEEGGGDEDMSGMARIVIRMNIRKQRYKPTRSGTSHEWRQFVFVLINAFIYFSQYFILRHSFVIAIYPNSNQFSSTQIIIE